LLTKNSTLTSHCRPPTTQAKLLNTSEGLLERTSHMRQLMELLLGAQAGALTFLERLSARQLSARDLAFWGAALALPLLFVGRIDIKLGLVAIVFVGFAVESALGLGGLRAGGGSFLGGAAAAAAASAGGGAGGQVFALLLRGGPGGRAAWAVRGLVVVGAAAFCGWRLHERGRAHRELVQEVKALREALEHQVGGRDGTTFLRDLRPFQPTNRPANQPIHQPTPQQPAPFRTPSRIHATGRPAAHRPHCTSSIRPHRQPRPRKAAAASRPAHRAWRSQHLNRLVLRESSTCSRRCRVFGAAPQAPTPPPRR
jgi:hypothetical protein